MVEDILWLITARSGSTGIPNKNIKGLGGFPLLAYKIKTALSVSPSDNVWVSTDSAEYARIAEKHGAQVPFIRPPELATNSASSIDVVLHAMDIANRKEKKYNFIGLLEPTSPFVYVDDIQNALGKLKKNVEANAIVAVKESRPNTFFIQQEKEYLDIISKRLKEKEKLGRQAFNKEITPSGGFYISRWGNFLKEKTFYTDKTLAYLLPNECELEIDEPMDWLWAEFLIKEQIIDINKLWK